MAKCVYLIGRFVIRSQDIVKMIYQPDETEDKGTVVIELAGGECLSYYCYKPEFDDIAEDWINFCESH